MSQAEHQEGFTRAGLFDPSPAAGTFPLPIGFRLLQVWQVLFFVLELIARVRGEAFFIFGHSPLSLVANMVFGPLNFWSTQRRSPRLRSGAYIFLSLEAMKGISLLVQSYDPIWQPAALLGAALLFIAYLQLPPVVRAVPRVNPGEMKNRWLQRFQRTLNG